MLSNSRTPNRMNTTEASIRTYLYGTSLLRPVPKDTLITVTTRNADITPRKIGTGASYLAASTMAASCVLSPSSMEAISRKDVARDDLWLLTPPSVAFVKSVRAPNRTNATPDPTPTQDDGIMAANALPIRTLMPSTREKARMAPRKTGNGLWRADRVMVAMFVLSPSSERMTKPNDDMSGVRSKIR